MPEERPKPKIVIPKKERANISNLPEAKLAQIRGTDDQKEVDFLGPRITNKKRVDLFAAWDDREKIEIDFTTEIILADNEQFDMLAERGYETLYEYGETGEKKPL